MHENLKHEISRSENFLIYGKLHVHVLQNGGAHQRKRLVVELRDKELAKVGNVAGFITVCTHSKHIA